MNEHIELVKKFLTDDTSVTEEELRANKDAVVARAAAAEAAWEASDYKCDAEYASFRAAIAAEAADAAADAAALWAFRAAEADNLENAEYYKKKAREAIAEYEELTR